MLLTFYNHEKLIFYSIYYLISYLIFIITNIQMNITNIKLIHPCIDEKDCVFKSCDYEWIVVLKKLSDTLTNEDRHCVVDARYAKFRANKLKVMLIFNKLNPNK